MFKAKMILFVWWLVRFLVVLYLGILVLLFSAQRKLIFHPERGSQQDMAKLAQQRGFEAWQNSAGQFIGWKHNGKERQGHARLLIVHGNAGCAVERIDYADGLQGIEPMDVYILEYPGYGARDGKPSQKSLFAAAGEAIELLRQDNAPIYIMGESLGTGVAAYLAGSYPGLVRGLLLIAPYNNLTEVAQAHIPFAPVSLLLLDRFPSATYLKKYHGPVAMRFAGQDEIVPNRFGLKLYDGYEGPKKFWEVPQAGHNDLLNQEQGWWRDVAEFWKTNARATR